MPSTTNPCLATLRESNGTGNRRLIPSTIATNNVLFLYIFSYVTVSKLPAPVCISSVTIFTTCSGCCSRPSSTDTIVLPPLNTPPYRSLMNCTAISKPYPCTCPASPLYSVYTNIYVSMYKYMLYVRICYLYV